VRIALIWANGSRLSPFTTKGNFLADVALQNRAIRHLRPVQQGIQMKTGIKTSTLPNGLPLTFYFAAAAILLALLAIPHAG
jgi:hypothetical protein